MSYLVPTPVAMEVYGGHLARACRGRGIFHLCGELGVGKTTLVRGFLRALGHRDIVKSPTYTLVEPYQLDEQIIYHFDLYRLGIPEELEYLGIRDYLADNVVCLIEWSERGGEFTPPADVQVELSYHGNARLLALTAHSTLGETIIANLCNAGTFAKKPSEL